MPNKVKKKSTFYQIFPFLTLFGMLFKKSAKNKKMQHLRGRFKPGALQYQMDTGVRLTLPKAGAFSENTVSKNEESLGEKPNFGSKLGGIG